MEKTNVLPHFEEIQKLKTYSDFRRLIKGQTSKSMRHLYQESYYREGVGSKEIADLYFETKGLGPNPYTELPLKLARVKPGHHVLDIGCGRGEIVFQTACLGAYSVGIDFSRHAISLAMETRARHCADIVHRTDFICCDAADLDFPDNRFDRIFLLDVAEHVSREELRNILRKCGTLLTQSGLLVIHSTPNLWARTYGYWIKALLYFVTKGTLPSHPFIAEIKRSSNFIMHINEQSILSLKLHLFSSGLKSKVWLQNPGVSWIEMSAIRRKLLHKIFIASGATYVFGSDLYALAWREES